MADDLDRTPKPPGAEGDSGPHQEPLPPQSAGEQDVWTASSAVGVAFSTVWALDATDTIGLWGGFSAADIDINAGPPDTNFTAVIVETL